MSSFESNTTDDKDITNDVNNNINTPLTPNGILDLFGSEGIKSGRHVKQPIVQIINITAFWVVIEITAVARRHELTLGVGLLVELLGCVTSFFALSFLFWCLVLLIFVLLR